MSNLFSKRNILRCRRGNSVIEFAIVAPVLVTFMFGFLEVGRAFNQANAVEKGLRAGAFYAAHTAQPLTADAITVAKNIAKTGQPTGGSYLVSGYAKGGDVTFTTGSFSLNGTSVPVVKASASVPFDPLVPVFMKTLGLDTYKIQMSHEQVYLGS